MRLLPILALILLVFACQPKTGELTGGGNTDNNQTMAALPIPSAWTIVSCTRNGKTVAAANDKGFIAIREGQIGGNTGCNSFGGDWTGKAARMNVSGVMGTMMYCEDVADQDRMVLDLLNGTVETSVSGGVLTMKGAGITLKLQRNDKLLK